MRPVIEIERALRARTTEASTLLAEQTQRAEAESRARTPEEVAAVETMLVEARDLRAQLERREHGDATTAEIARLTAGLPTHESRAALPAAPATPHAPRGPFTLGEQWIASPAHAFFQHGGARSAAAWRSPSAELTVHSRAAYLAIAANALYGATLTEGPTSGGALIVPDYRPGILPLLFNVLGVADLMAPGTTTSNLVTYMIEKTFVNAADTVAEGAAKPESTLTFEAASDAVRKIAHWLPVTEEMLEDEPQIRSYIDSRLILGIQLAEDDQLLQGSGVAPDILGVRNRPGIAAPIARNSAATPPENNADAIYRQIVAITTASLMQPDGIVMNPANWGPIELMKSTTGEYMAGGPFVQRVTRTLWGLPVSITTAEPAGTSTVGAFRQASQFFRKGGIRVEASNSHVDYFVKNLVAIRAEERGALAVYRPGAFGDVTGLQ